MWFWSCLNFWYLCLFSCPIFTRCFGSYLLLCEMWLCL
jgi:hypothetical protein